MRAAFHLPAVALLAAAVALPGAAPAAEKGDAARPALTSTSPAPAPAGVASTYDQMEKNIELQYAKLIQDERKEIASLQTKIKELEGQIAGLKQQASRIEILADKIATLLPVLLESVAADPTPGKGRKAAAPQGTLGARIAAELDKSGLGLSPDERTAVLHVANDGPQSLTAVAGRFQKWELDELGRINAAIEAKQKAIAALKKQVAQAESQIAKLEQQKNKELEALKLARAKALAAEIKWPAPTPLPAKP
jgi:cell division protein FtsB